MTSISRIHYLGEPETPGTPIGFCIESPVQVLARLYPTRRIIRYNNVFNPFNYDIAAPGLAITNNEPPTGTTISGSLDALLTSDSLSGIFSCMRSHFEDNSITKAQREVKRSLQRDLSYDASGRESQTNYLFTRDTQRNYSHELRVQDFLEIVQATCGIPNPDIEVLKAILG